MDVSAKSNLRKRGLLVGAIVVASAGGLALTVLVNGRKTVDPLASGLLQFFFVVVGVAASFAFGRISSELAAAELVKRDARKAVRRIVGLARTTQLMSSVINDRREFLERQAGSGAESIDVNEELRTLAVLDHVILTQLAQAQDSIEDWRDVVPDEVAEVESPGELEVN
jgi:hypothetical protein